MDACQAVAVLEGNWADCRHGVRDGDARHVVAIIERSLIYPRHGVGDERVLATCYELVVFRLDDGVAVLAAVIDRISRTYFNTPQTGTELDGIYSPVIHMLRNKEGV